MLQDLACTGAENHLEGIGLVWGCDHLPGLARLFTGAGYRLSAGRWIDACAI